MARLPRNTAAEPAVPANIFESLMKPEFWVSSIHMKKIIIISCEKIVHAFFKATISWIRFSLPRTNINPRMFIVFYDCLIENQKGFCLKFEIF